MNDADRKIVERLQQRARDARLVAESIELHTKGKTGYDIQLDEDAVSLIESQAAEIEQHSEVAYESAGLAGERIGTIAALRHEVADQVAKIEELEAGPKWEVFQTCLDRAIEEGVEKVVAKFWRNEVIVARQTRDKADEEILRLKGLLAAQAAAEKEQCDA